MQIGNSIKFLMIYHRYVKEPPYIIRRNEIVIAASSSVFLVWMESYDLSMRRTYTTFTEQLLFLPSLPSPPTLPPYLPLSPSPPLVPSPLEDFSIKIRFYSISFSLSPKQKEKIIGVYIRSAFLKSTGRVPVNVAPECVSWITALFSHIKTTV